MQHRRHTYWLVFAFVVAIATTAVAQPIVPTDDATSVDSTPRNPALPTPDDTSDASSDSLRVDSRDASGSDTVVSYSARDSMKLSIGGKIMRLYGDAEVIKGAMHLTAGYIEIDFRKSELYARAVYDSAAKQYTGVPVFKDASQEFSALSMRYNFRTGKGVTESAETRFDDGFYNGKKIKLVDRNTLFIQDGVYTTCDAPHPHYFFRSERMKVVVGDKVFVDQPTLNVADVPIFFIPIGVFFARSGGKQSGLIIPTWSQSPTRGFSVEGLGYFWAGNDYVDAKLLANLYSKGGYSLNTVIRARVRGTIDIADLDYTFGRTRDDPDQELATSHHVRYVHGQKIGRRSQFGGVLDFSTLNAVRLVATAAENRESYDDFTRQLLISNLSYSTGFDWGSFSAQYDRTQNVVTGEVTQRAPITVSIPTWTPFATGGIEQGVFDNLSLSYTGRATWEEVRQDTIAGGGFRINDTRRGIQHSPSINLTLPRIGYLNITPSVQFQGSTFFRRTSKQYVNDSTLVTTTSPQFRQTFTYSASVGITTTLYGIVQPRIFGVNVLRHVLQPTISFRYRPDFGEPRYDYFDSVMNPRTGLFQRYSVFEADALVAPTPGSGLENSVSLGLQNTFEAKIAQGDTVDDRRVRLLSLGASTSYNAASPTFKWSEVFVRANTDLGSVGSLSADLNLDPYDTDSTGARVPRLLIDADKGLLRVTSGGVRFNMSFSDQGFGSTVAPPVPSDSVSARRERFDFEPIAFDESQFFGDEVRGATDFRIPWTISLSGAYSISRDRLNDFTEFANLTAGLNFGLTPTTRISTSLSYDVIESVFLIPSITFQKDLHCWELQFDWQPSGFRQGFYFRLGIKSPQLRDIELERQGAFYDQ